jgi:hypothetical protein
MKINKKISIISLSIVTITIVLLVISKLLIKVEREELLLPLGKAEKELYIIPSKGEGYLAISPRIFYIEDNIGIYSPNYNKVLIYDQKFKFKRFIELPYYEGYFLTGIDSIDANEFLLEYIKGINFGLLFDKNSTNDDVELVKLIKFNVNGKNEQEFIINEDFTLSENPQLGDLVVLDGYEFTTGEGFYRLNTKSSQIEDISSNFTIGEKEVIIAENKIIYKENQEELELEYSPENLCNPLKISKAKLYCVKDNTKDVNEILDKNFIYKYDLMIFSSSGKLDQKYSNIIDYDVNEESIAIVSLDNKGKEWLVKKIEL